MVAEFARIRIFNDQVSADLAVPTAAGRKNRHFSRNLAAQTSVNTVTRQWGNRRVPPPRLDLRSPIPWFVQAHFGQFGSQFFTREEVV